MYFKRRFPKKVMSVNLILKIQLWFFILFASTLCENGIALPKEKFLTPQGFYHIDYHKEGKVKSIVFVNDFNRTIDFKQTTAPFKEQLNCCNVISSNLIWRVIVNLRVDTTNLENIEEDYIKNILNESIFRYETAIGDTIFGEIEYTIIQNFELNQPNGLNDIIFAPIESPTTIALTNVRFILNGENPQFVEADIIINSNFMFSGEVFDSEKFDLFSILMHEMGHLLGLAHPPTISECSESTMFATAIPGEIKKRDLTDDDNICISTLYSTGVFPQNGSSQTLTIYLSAFSVLLMFF